MDIRFQRSVDRWAGIPACAALSLWHRGARSLFRRKATHPPKRILVILLSEMGATANSSATSAEVDRRERELDSIVAEYNNQRQANGAHVPQIAGTISSCRDSHDALRTQSATP